MAVLRFGVLGPLSVDQGPVPGAKNRALLGTLLLRAGRLVTIDQLAERLWDDEPPGNPRRVVQTHVVRLRRWLGDGAEIHTRGGGYLMELDPERLDLLAFRRLLAEAASEGDPGRERDLLRRALALWRGPVCADVASGALRELDVPVIAEQHQRALERRIDLDLRLGHDLALIAELRALTSEFPLHERYWAQLMAALHGGGRRAEALDAYRAAFRRLRDELGIEPGPELREQHEAILAGQPPRTAAPIPALIPAPIPVPRELPPDVLGFQGRESDLADLAGQDVTAVVGPAGVGKSALAVRWANAAAAGFPDGQLYVNLRGHAAGPPLEPSAALRSMLRGLGVTDVPAEPAEAAALFRSRTAGRRLLVVLDDARDSAQVRPLLPGRGAVAVVTSRDQLRDLVVAGTARRIVLGPLRQSDALALLAGVVGPERVAREPEAARRLVARCDHLPLAVRVVGERLTRRPGLPLRSLPAEPLAEVQKAISWSYDALDPPAQRVLRFAGGLHPAGEIDPGGLAAMLRLSPDRAGNHLDTLVAGHLAEPTPAGHYRVPPLVREFAAGRPIAPDDREAGIDALLAWYLDRVDRACPGWLDWHCEVLDALPAWAAGHGRPRVARRLTSMTESLRARLLAPGESGVPR